MKPEDFCYFIPTDNQEIFYNKNLHAFAVKGISGVFPSYNDALKAWKAIKGPRIFVVYERNEMSPHAFFSTKEKAETYVRLLQSVRYTIEEQILDAKEV